MPPQFARLDSVTQGEVAEPDWSRLPSLTIAVCTRDRAGQLRNALSSLARLELDRICRPEFLIVDNASGDDTEAVARDFIAHVHVPARYVHEPTIGFASARNRATRESLTEWLAFLDDDEVADPHWARELLSCAARHRVKVVGGAVALNLNGNPELLGRFCRKLFGDTTGHATERPFDRHFQPGAGNLLVHRSVFDSGIRFGTETPAYGDQHRGEDTRWFHRALQCGISMWYTPRAVVTHVIDAERLRPDALKMLSRKSGKAADLSEWIWERKLGWVALARGYRVVIWRFPFWVWKHLFGNNAEALDEDCQLAWEFTRFWEELKWILLHPRK
jgi:glycosyltransferase involved in cell wall biosynthesis